MLSNYCIFDIIDNSIAKAPDDQEVVNCFQIIVSLTLLTTISRIGEIRASCELLSNYCIFDIIDNSLTCHQVLQALWIAFKLLYLWHYWQLLPKYCLAPVRCELLSNYCIFDIIDNVPSPPPVGIPVVNCFQIIVSLTLLTTFCCFGTILN